MLQRAVFNNELGIMGTHSSLECLRNARADVLVLAEEYDPGAAWQCKECGNIQIGREAAQACPECFVIALAYSIFELDDRFADFSFDLTFGFEIGGCHIQMHLFIDYIIH
jgi:hypothetical protein